MLWLEISQLKFEIARDSGVRRPILMKFPEYLARWHLSYHVGWPHKPRPSKSLHSAVIFSNDFESGRPGSNP